MNLACLATETSFREAEILAMRPRRVSFWLGALGELRDAQSQK